MIGAFEKDGYQILTLDKWRKEGDGGGNGKRLHFEASDGIDDVGCKIVLA